MFARHRQVFATAIFLIDGAMIAGSWMAAYWLRFYGLGIASPLGIPPQSQYLWIGAILTPVALLILRTLGLYRSARTARLSQELYGLAQGIAIVTALAAVFSFFIRGEFSRSTLLLFAGVATIALGLSRVAIRLALRALRRRGRNLRAAVIVGTGTLADRVARKIAAHPDFGLVVKGVVSEEGGRIVSDSHPTLARLPVLGTVHELATVVDRAGAELVYLALARAEHRAEEEALAQLDDSTAAVRMVPDLGRAFTLNATVEDFDGMPVVLVTESPGQGWNAVLKRGFDLLLTTLGLVVLAPILLAVAMWVRLDSPGPVLYVQERLGANGRRFRMLKFRTMQMDAESDNEPGWTRAGDPRRTRAGRILRSLSIDELPQLWNVFLGHMSLVGPRPERPVYVDQFRTSIPRYMLRHHVKGGITGWAQINGLRGDTPLDARVEYDLFYIRNWSLALDLKILWLTLVRVFRDANAH
jgi:Undecaprenyl-phosphate glucose phosphotransferase